MATFAVPPRDRPMSARANLVKNSSPPMNRSATPKKMKAMTTVACDLERNPEHPVGV